MSANLLARIPIFAELPDEELNRLMSELTVVNLKSGEVLFREGDPGEHLYVVVSGALEIVMGPGNESEVIINIVGEEEYIGEMSLLQPDGHRTTGARARGDVTLLSMSRKQFQDLLRRHPELAKSMIAVLSQRLVNTNVQTVRGLTEKNRQLQEAYNDLKAAQEQLLDSAWSVS